uniref:F-box domain-containing protein n=2 Tax=Plectus sambesii TaxID=2011161 RepID=A0A914WRD9_9BILA
MSTDCSSQLSAKVPLKVPSLDELVSVLQPALSANFAVAEVSAIDCPDLSTAPFNLMASGLTGSVRIGEVGGVGNILPVTNKHKAFNLKKIAETCELPEAFLIGPGAGPWPVVGCCCEMVANCSFAEGQSRVGTKIAKIVPETGEYAQEPISSTDFSLMANLLISEGLPGQVLRVYAKQRTGETNFPNCLRQALADHYGKETVSLGGVFLLKSGKAKLHVMPDFPAVQMANDKEVSEWLKYFEMAAPIVFASVFHSHDPGFSLRPEHTHGFSEHGDAGHYHHDTTPDEVEYEGYFVPAETIYRIDQVSDKVDDDDQAQKVDEVSEQAEKVDEVCENSPDTVDASFTIELKPKAPPTVANTEDQQNETKTTVEKAQPPTDEAKTLAAPKPKTEPAKTKTDKTPAEKTKPKTDAASAKVATSAAAKVNGAVAKPEKPTLHKPPKPPTATTTVKDEAKPRPRTGSTSLKTKESTSRDSSKEPPKPKSADTPAEKASVNGQIDKECPKVTKKPAAPGLAAAAKTSPAVNGPAKTSPAANGPSKPPTKERRTSPGAVHTQEVVVKMPPRPTVSVTHLAVTMRDMPVELLQHVMSFLTYHETMKCRLVNRQFDTAAGERLNNGYRTMVKDASSKLNRAKKMLPMRDADRKEHPLQPVFSALTSFECFVLNPVDGITTAMDEGVSCFPYGLVLDAGFDFLRSVERAIRDGETGTVDWKPAADLSRVANGHYKRIMAPELDRRLGDVFRMKAAYKLQKFDSWMVENTVTNLERAASIAREDFNWEVDQLRNQTQQLKKENRELRHDYMKLEARVEMLENKFKTIGRLFQ